MNDPEAGIVNMIRCGMLALQLLPENSSAGMSKHSEGQQHCLHSENVIIHYIFQVGYLIIEQVM